MNQDREWFLEQSQEAQKLEGGFSVLSVDYSEHPATRFNWGVLGWVQAAGVMSDWHRVVAQIAFSIDEISKVSRRDHFRRCFLVRALAIQSAIQKSFESFSSLLSVKSRAD